MTACGLWERIKSSHVISPPASAGLRAATSGRLRYFKARVGQSASRASRSLDVHGLEGKRGHSALHSQARSGRQISPESPVDRRSTYPEALGDLGERSLSAFKSASLIRLAGRHTLSAKPGFIGRSGEKAPSSGKPGLTPSEKRVRKLLSEFDRPCRFFGMRTSETERTRRSSRLSEASGMRHRGRPVRRRNGTNSCCEWSCVKQGSGLLEGRQCECSSAPLSLQARLSRSLHSLACPSSLRRS